MSFTARDVIKGARVWHTSFSETVHPDTVVFDWLMSFLRVERRKIYNLVPEMLLTQSVITLPGSVFTEGVPIADAEVIFSVAALTSDTTRSVYGDDVPLIPLEHMADQGPWPAAAWVGGEVKRLYLKGMEASWLAYVELVVNYLKTPSAITTLDTVIPLPAPLLDVAIAGLCVFMAMRGGGEVVGAQQVGYFAQKESDARSASDAALASQRAGEAMYMRDLA